MRAGTRRASREDLDSIPPPALLGLRELALHVREYREVSALKSEARAMLEELATLLEELPPERFDYFVWVGATWQGQRDLSCGTVACAAGWATTLPSYQAKGLFLGQGLDDDFALESSIFYPMVWTVEGEWLDQTDAMAHVLDIPEEDASLLFVPRTKDSDLGMEAPAANASAKEVAAHIRRYIEVKG